MQDFFFYGTLCHRPLLAVVLGRDVPLRDACLNDHAVYWAEGHPFPLIVPQAGGLARGLLAEGLTAEDVARLDFYEGGFAFQTQDLVVETDAGARVARVYLPDPGVWSPGAGWSLADWAARWGDTVVATAHDFMALHGEKPSAGVLARYGLMLVRGGSRARAASAAPAGLRRNATPQDIRVASRSQPYANFFAVEEYDLAWRRFDGSFGATVNRAVFVSGDAVTVLPYDPVRDRVLLVEQFRPGPMARGDAQPWSLEAIAGRIDPGETPEAAARREAVEEAGLHIGALLSVAQYYPSPGAKTEYLYSYVALCDLPDGVAGVFGVEGEAEDIRGHLIAFDRLMALVATGEVANAPLLLTALWLQRERARLRGV